MGPRYSETPPRDNYVRRLEERRGDATRLGRREGILGNSRLAVFLAALGLAWLAFGAKLLSGWWLIVPLVLFTVLLFLHERVTRKWYRAGRAILFYQRGIARLDDAWAGKGQTGERFRDADHPYAADLDLFGPASLFELLCTARTRTGEDTLAGWLRGPAGADEVRARQVAVAELAPQLDLREELALLGDDVPVGVDFEGVAGWGQAAPLLTGIVPRLVGLVLGIAGLATLHGFLASGWGIVPLLAVIVLDLLFAASLKRRVDPVLSEVKKRARDLALLANVLARLEQASFTAPRLVELKAALMPEKTKTPPSQQIAQLGNLLDLLNSRRNQLFAPFAALLLWGTQMAYAIERWRARSGKAIAGWLTAVGQFEALCALRPMLSRTRRTLSPKWWPARRATMAKTWAIR